MYCEQRKSYIVYCTINWELSAKKISYGQQKIHLLSTIKLGAVNNNKLGIVNKKKMTENHGIGSNLVSVQQKKTSYCHQKN